MDVYLNGCLIQTPYILQYAYKYFKTLLADLERHYIDDCPPDYFDIYPKKAVAPSEVGVIPPSNIPRNITSTTTNTVIPSGSNDSAVVTAQLSYPQRQDDNVDEVS